MPSCWAQTSAAAAICTALSGRCSTDTDEKPGREYVDRARAVLSAEDVARATEAGRRLTIKEALDLTRSPETDSA